MHQIMDPQIQLVYLLKSSLDLTFYLLKLQKGWWGSSCWLRTPTISWRDLCLVSSLVSRFVPPPSTSLLALFGYNLNHWSSFPPFSYWKHPLPHSPYAQSCPVHNRVKFPWPKEQIRKVTYLSTCHTSSYNQVTSDNNVSHLNFGVLLHILQPPGITSNIPPNLLPPTQIGHLCLSYYWVS